MGVMTMKMISSTSITSTMGVTLMVELTFVAFVAYCDCHKVQPPVSCRVSAQLQRVHFSALPADLRRFRK